MKDGRVKRKILYYIISALGLLLLVGIAFMGPQMIFQAGDYYLWQNTELSERETMDIAVLTTTYEQSLRIRLKNFAEGLDRGEKYYVTSEDLAADRETFISSGINDKFQSFGGIYRSNVLLLGELELFPLQIFDEGYIFNFCRQYVVYSDNYAKGVNFILWCLELESLDGIKLTMLMDAEDGTIYAMKFGGLGQAVTLNPHYKFLFGEFDDGLESFSEQYAFAHLFCSYYDAIEDMSMRDAAFYEEMLRKNAVNRNAFVLDIPFDDYSLEFCVRLSEDYWVEEVVIDADGNTEYITKIDSTWSYLPQYPEFVSGITDIYRLIPEFADEIEEE